MKNLDINLYLSIISLIIGFGYVFFYMLSGRNQNPLTYRYQKVLNDKTLLRKHLIFSFLLSSVGIFRYNSLTLETYLFSPLIFITLLIFSNTIIQKKYNRNILIETFNRYSFAPRINKKATYLDIFFGLLIAILSLVGPIIMKSDKFDEINRERKKFKSSSIEVKRTHENLKEYSFVIVNPTNNNRTANRRLARLRIL
jgi:hypothetical protein